MKRTAVWAALVTMLVLGAGSVASAETSSRPCTIGDAQANFEAPLQHILGSLGVCQYRLFFDGDSFTFCEGDFILGGALDFVDYPAQGMTREEAIALLERFGERVWLDGVEQPLMHTAFKDGMHPRFGHLVYQHHAFIAQLPPGSYVSYFEATTDGVVELTATVTLHVLPSSDAACR
jgi:hypothetical protein